MSCVLSLKKWALCFAALVLASLAFPDLGTAQSVTQNSQGTIEILGTAQADLIDINVEAGSAANRVTIVVNGTTYRFDSVNGLEIWGGGGEDDITLQEVHLPGSLVVRCGSAADRMKITKKLYVEGNVDINLGDGDNEFWFQYSVNYIKIGGDWTMRLGRDDDELLNYTQSGFFQINGNVWIELGDGANRCSPGGDYYSPLLCKKTVSIFGGDGIDNIALKGARIEGDALIEAGDGNNLLQVLHLQQRGDLRVIGGKENDAVTLNIPQIRGTATFMLGGGDDEFTFGGWYYLYSMVPYFEHEPFWLNVDMGDGDDTSFWSTKGANADIRVSYGDGINVMEIESSEVVKPIAIEARHDLTLVVEQSYFQAPLDVDIPNGVGSVLVDHCEFRESPIFSFGPEEDGLYVLSSEFRKPLYADMGEGDDWVEILDTLFLTYTGYSMRIDGGRDFDTLDFSGSNPPREEPILSECELINGF